MHDSRLVLAKQLLPTLLQGSDPRLAVLRAQLEVASVSIKSNTNWGFFAELGIPGTAAKLEPPDFCGGNAEIEVEGVRVPAGCVLYVEQGVLSYLEVYTHDGPWEHPPVFKKVSFIQPVVPGEHVRSQGERRGT
jgi:hypothetical protein